MRITRSAVVMVAAVGALVASPMAEGLSRAQAQNAVNQAFASIKTQARMPVAASVSVRGVVENSSGAEADLAFDGAKFVACNNDITLHAGTATFRHYNDGRWVLTRVNTDEFCISYFEVNVEVGPATSRTTPPGTGVSRPKTKAEVAAQFPEYLKGDFTKLGGTFSAATAVVPVGEITARPDVPGRYNAAVYIRLTCGKDYKQTGSLNYECKKGEQIGIRFIAEKVGYGENARQWFYDDGPATLIGPYSGPLKNAR